jgi:hypothetical protein
MSRLTGHKFFILFGILFFVVSCYEPVNDCLDILATNYEVSSDEACDDCCTYPTLSLKLEHTMLDSLDFNEDSTYLTRFSDTYQIKNLQYFISDFKVLGEDLVYKGVVETIEIIDINGNKVSGEDNFIFVTTDEDSYNFGTFLSPGNYSKIRFLLGLEVVVNHGDLSSLDSDHPLLSSQDSMYIDQENGYYFTKMKLVLDPTNTNVSNSISISGDLNLVVVEIDHEFSAAMGDNLSFTIKADYSNWFNNQELSTLESEEIASNIVGFAASAFSIVE